MYSVTDILHKFSVFKLVKAESDALSYFQVCLCTSRIFVQRSLYEKFLEKFVALARLVSFLLFLLTDPLWQSHHILYIV